MGRPAKYPPQDFNGTRYYRKPRGYFKSDDGVYIHRAVWIFHNGPIPPGHDVHHADDDKSNNVIGNLECLTKAEHASHHGRKRLPKGSEEARVHMEVIRPAASAWHGSDAGKQWHKDHGKRTWEDRKSEDLRCTHCGGCCVSISGAKGKRHRRRASHVQRLRQRVHGQQVRKDKDVQSTLCEGPA